jgi:hypothetical protein
MSDGGGLDIGTSITEGHVMRGRQSRRVGSKAALVAVPVALVAGLVGLGAAPSRRKWVRTGAGRRAAARTAEVARWR